jgi:hypothetical protein
MPNFIQSSLSTIALCGLPCALHYYTVHRPTIKKMQSNYDKWMKEFDNKAKKREQDKKLKH